MMNALGITTVAVPVTCAVCHVSGRATQVQALDEGDLKRWTAMPPGWWSRPTYVGGVWGISAFCSDACARSLFGGAVERPSLIMHCATCGTKDFGLRLREFEEDEESLDQVSLLPSGWFGYLVDHGDRDGDDGDGAPMLMLHGVCGPACIERAVAEARGIELDEPTPEPPPQPRPSPGNKTREKAPLTATLGDLIRRR